MPPQSNRDKAAAFLGTAMMLDLRLLISFFPFWTAHRNLHHRGSAVAWLRLAPLAGIGRRRSIEAKLAGAASLILWADLVLTGGLIAFG